MSARGTLTARENRLIQALCAVYAARLLGLYMVLPVLSPYASKLAGATPLRRFGPRRWRASGSGSGRPSESR